MGCTSGSCKEEFFQACDSGDLEAVLRCLEDSPRLVEQRDPRYCELQRTGLHNAAEKGDSQLVHHLLKARSDANARTGHKSTPLHYAALNRHVAIVPALLAANADVSAVNAMEETAMDIARRGNNTALIEALAAGSERVRSGPVWFSCNAHEYGKAVRDEEEELEDSHEKQDPDSPASPGASISI
eukprot:TRINITY_DN46390_c0_g1_i1.p1 TRINITY_DN46390_c0_g1~~TRINITY_DN46390_c0_g1_i1.p1  ORF type:complete len:185 (-),score=35.49 TRINITY_DN46390_c0_g1_i1:149-703(-)